jgi:hypothetical protein
MTKRAKCASDDRGPRRRALDGWATGPSRWRQVPPRTALGARSGPFRVVALPSELLKSSSGSATQCRRP